MSETAQQKRDREAKAQESSQTTLEDFSAPKLSETDPALFMQAYNKNEIELAGKVIELSVSEAKPKIDKQTNEHSKDANGNLEYWEPFYSASIIFEGGELNMNLSKDIYEKLVIGKRFLFSGMMGLSFKKVQPKFYNATLIA